MRQLASFLFEERQKYAILDHISDDECFNRYKFRKRDLQLLFEEIESHFSDVTCWKRSDVTPFHQMLIALRYYASGSFQINSGDLLQVSQPTVSRCIKRVSRAIASLSQHYLQFPSSDEQDAIKKKFYAIDGFPGVIGAIDCTHIPYSTISERNRERFRNRKNFMSINVQAVVDADMNFINIVARWPGSTHDARIFDNSRLRMRLEVGDLKGKWIIGDGGYANCDYLLTPYRSPSSNSEIAFNVSHIKTRNVIERTFGAWKKVFHVLSSGLSTRRDTALNTIVACAVLWNFRRLIYSVEDDSGHINFEDEDADSGNVAADEDRNTWSRRDIITREYFRS